MKRPTRHGQPWTVDDIKQLLTVINHLGFNVNKFNMRNITLETTKTVADALGRTPDAIIACWDKIEDHCKNAHHRKYDTFDTNCEIAFSRFNVMVADKKKAILMKPVPKLGKFLIICPTNPHRNKLCASVQEVKDVALGSWDEYIIYGVDANNNICKMKVNTTLMVTIHVDLG